MNNRLIEDILKNTEYQDTNIVSSFIEDLLKEHYEFSIGLPWINSDLSITCVVPLIRNSEKKPDYIVLSQSENVVITDTGSIDKVKIKNNESKPVFVRMGELLTGSSQERSVVTSRVVMPGKEEIINYLMIKENQHGNNH